MLAEGVTYFLLFKRRRPVTVPITIVDHKEDGSWQFFSGTYLTKVKITSLEEAIESDITIKEVKDLSSGCSAMRKNSDSVWMRYKTSEGKAVSEDYTHQ